jgi:hypothetical protein
MFADANGITWKCKLKNEQVYFFNFQQYLLCILPNLFYFKNKDIIEFNFFVNAIDYITVTFQLSWLIKVITKLPNSEQSYKGKVQTHNYINRQNQSTTVNIIYFFDIYVTEYGTALTTILPILFLYLNTVTVTAGTLEA